MTIKKRVIKPIKTAIKEEKRQTHYCVACEADKPIGSFYNSTNELHAKTGKYPVCKECITKKLPKCDYRDPNAVAEIVQNYDYIKTFKEILFDLNRPFILVSFQRSIIEIQKSKKELFGVYMKNISMFNLNETSADSNNLTIEEIIFHSKQDGNGEFIKSEHANVRQIEEINVEIDTDSKKSPRKTKRKYSFDDSAIEITKEDLETQKDCIRLLGYDPFVGVSELDRKMMYSELIPYLDEDTLEDQYLLSVITQIVINNNQTRNFDLIINKMMATEKDLIENAVVIEKLTTTKKKISETNDKLAKENSIAAKHRADKKQGRSTLGYMMKDLREFGFEDAEEDYYDMNRAYGMQVTAEISTKAIFSQLSLGENDYEDMIKKQSILIDGLRKDKEELEEKLRLANVSIDQLTSKNINE